MFKPTSYTLKSLCCGKEFKEEGWSLVCPDGCQPPAFIRAEYEKKQLEVGSGELGLYRFSDWLPVQRILDGSAPPVTYRSESLASALNLNNLFITFNGWWPEKGAFMKTGSFKECEAFSVCGRMGSDFDKVLVVASAGNTARAFARVCSENNIPLLLSVPEDNLSALWFDAPKNDCVKLISPESGGDYFDAIALAAIASGMEGYAPEGGAKNVARRDGMATTMLSAVTTIGAIPDYYFQAVGSGTGAIAAWEANMRFIEDGRFGKNKAKLMLAQNSPFTLMADTWGKRQRELIDLNPNTARKQVEEIQAKVLSNRRPPWGPTGALFDAMNDTNGLFYTADNTQAEEAGKLFQETEGIDISPAASVACSALMQAVENGDISSDETVMLNITGGGMERFKSEHKLYSLKPSRIFPLNPDENGVKEYLSSLFN